MLHLALRSMLVLAIACVGAACARVATGEQPGSLRQVEYRVEQTFEVDLAPQPVAVARVAPNGTIYLVDIPRSAVVAYTPQGELLWSHEIAPEQGRKRSPVAIDIDPNGNVLVFESYAADVHVFDPSGRPTARTAVSASSGPSYSPRPSGILAARGPDDFLVLLGAGDRSVSQFNASGEPVRAFGASASVDGAKAGGWVHFTPQRTLLHRRAGTVTFDIFREDRTLLRTVSPSEIPFQPTTPSNRPGDTIFTTDLLPDGRIIMEIAHRTPYQAYENRLRTVVTLGEYIVDLDGGVELMLPKRIGQLAAAGPNGELYFLKTRPALRDGEPSQLLRVVVG